MDSEVKIIKGGIAVDDRGMLSFINEFDFEGVKRFYMVENFEKNFIRAWHGHKNEGKYVTVVSGTAKIGYVDLREIEDWNMITDIITCEEPPDHVSDDVVSKIMDTEAKYITCSARTPSIIWIPPGFVNGAMNLEPDTRIVYFSTKGLGESEGDDYRYPWLCWGEEGWEPEYR